MTLEDDAKHMEKALFWKGEYAPQRWVQLTDAFNGEKIWINRDQICAVYRHEGDAWTVSSVDGFRYVKEGPDVILGKETT
jgi:hypothetical protein